MSSENVDGVSARSPDGSNMSVSDPKKPRIRYTRDFLLSFSGLDVCKKLPLGFDQSILSELEEAANNSFDRQRSLGSSSLQGPRWGEYGSQSMNRSESRTKWSSVFDRDADHQADRESFVHDSGRRFGGQNRCVPQHAEHDGLLGSGAFARPSGYEGAPPQKARGSGHSQLSRCAEPYQTPRPYKVAPYSRKDNNDSCNDETFGSTECSSEDRAEEERKRRESFELMRKEQKKVLQGKQRHNKDIPKENLDMDIMTLLQNSDTDKHTKSGSKLDESTSPLYRSDSKTSSHIHIPTARPLVPPGFAGALIRDKNHQMHSSGTFDASQVSNASVSDDFLPDMGNDQVRENDFTAHMKQNLQKIKLNSTSMHSVDEKEKSPVVSSNTGFNNISFNTSIPPKVDDVWDDILNGPSNDKEADSDVVNIAHQENSTSILHKLFGSAMATNANSLANANENYGIKADDEARNHLTSASSKFAHPLEESEGKNHTENISSRDLLSLIVNNDEVGSEVYIASNDESIKQMQSNLQSNLPSESSDTASRLLTSPPSPVSTILTNLYQIDRKSPSCAVLTCEDLEQSMLAEIKDGGSSSQFLQGLLTVIDGSNEEQKEAVDDNASQHLLSLLQMGIKSKSSAVPAVIGSSEMLAASDVEANLSLQDADSGTKHTSEKHLTLEALFGAAFMNELHSKEAPISAQTGSIGSINNDAIRSPGFSYHSEDNLTSAFTEHTKKAILEDETLQFNNNTKHTRAKNIHLPEEAAGDIHLPEEDTLISLNESLDPVASNSLCFAKENRNKPLIPEKPVGDLNDKLLHAFLRDVECSRQPVLDHPNFMRASREIVDPDGLYHHLQGKQAPQFPHQISHSRPFVAHLDQPTYGNPRMKFVDLDAMYPGASMISHHSYNRTTGPQFDPTAHRMVQPVPVPRYLSPHYSIQGIPHGLPLTHPMNHMPGLSPEMDNRHGFSLHQRQPNHGGLAMGMPGPVHGSTGGPEALERLLEMEIRANPKQYHHAIPGNVSGMFGPEVNMNFRYR